LVAQALTLTFASPALCALRDQCAEQRRDGPSMREPRRHHREGGAGEDEREDETDLLRGQAYVLEAPMTYR
jgi:hypothetical protein